LIGLLVDPLGSRMLILAAAFYVAALIPVAAVDVVAPNMPPTAQLHLLKAFRVSQVGSLSCLHTGLVAATFFGIGPLYGQALGLDTRQIVLMMAWAQCGMLVQWPLGLLSDRFDRRYLLIAMSVALIALSAALIVFGRNLPMAGLFALFAGFSGIAESYYPIGVAHANDRAQPADYVTISSNLLLIWALGRMAGPIIGTSALKHGGPAGLAWYAIVLTAAFALYTGWRLRTSARLVEEDREEFVTYPATSPTVFEWIQLRKLRRDKEPAA
jgi:MFS family permease